MLLIASCLLIAGWRAANPATDNDQDYVASEADSVAPSTGEGDLQPVRRLRASLSMPYFSFERTFSPRD
jgi:hypothetical protein